MNTKLKTILLGTSEQRKERALHFKRQALENPVRTGMRMLFEPGYTFRRAIYFDKEISDSRCHNDNWIFGVYTTAVQTLIAPGIAGLCGMAYAYLTK